MRYKSFLLFIIALGLGTLALGQGTGGIYRISNETASPITVAYSLEYHFGQCTHQKESLVSQIPPGVVDFHFKNPQQLHCSSTSGNNVVVLTINQIDSATAPPCSFTDNLKPNESIATMVIAKTPDGNWICYPKADLQ